MKTKSINIAILSIGRESPLIFGFRRAFKELDIKGKIIGLDMDVNAVGLYLADQGIHVPSYNNSDFNKYFTNIIERENIDLIIPTSDYDLRWWVNNHKYFEENKQKFIFSNVKSIRETISKKQFFAKLEKLMIPSPKVIDDIALKNKSIEFPIFINSNFGSGSSKANKIVNYNELDYFINKIDDYVITEYLVGRELSIDCYFTFDQTLISAIPRIRLYTFGGESFVTKTIDLPGIVPQIKKLTNNFNFKGAVNIQAFLKDDDELKFFEINPRFGGASRLTWLAGCDSPKFILIEYFGGNIKPVLGLYQSNLLMLRYKDDLILQQNELI